MLGRLQRIFLIGMSVNVIFAASVIANENDDAVDNIVGETFDSSIPTGDIILGAYDRVDVTATFKPSRKLSVLLSVDNLLDEGYQEAIGFPSPETRARFGLRYRF